MIPTALVALVRVILGGLFLFSGVVKFFGLKRFALIIASYGMLPRQLVKPFAYTLPFAETIVGLWLLSNQALQWSGLAALILLIISTGGVLGALIKKKRMENCGCYGVLVKVPLSWKKFVENIFWIALAVVLVWSVWYA